MARSSNGSTQSSATIGFEAKLWLTADKLRNNMDAAEYKPVTYLRQLRMVVPPPALLKVFDATVREIHLKMADNDHQSRTLATLRDTLLPKLLSGELSVAKLRN